MIGQLDWISQLLFILWSNNNINELHLDVLRYVDIKYIPTSSKECYNNIAKIKREPCYFTDIKIFSIINITTKLKLTDFSSTLKKNFVDYYIHGTRWIKYFTNNPPIYNSLKTKQDDGQWKSLLDR